MLGDIYEMKNNSRKTIRVATTILTTLDSVGGIVIHDTSKEAIPAPRAGCQLCTTVFPVSGAIKTTIATLTPGANKFMH